MKIQGRIYRIIGDTNEHEQFKVYVGSTTLTLQERLICHEANYRQHTNKAKRYCSSFEVLKCPYYEILLEEEIEFENVNELLQAERKAYEKYKLDTDNYVIVNKNTPARDHKEYYAVEDGKKSIKKYQQSIKGKEALSRANKKYYEKNIEEQRTKKRLLYHQKKAQKNNGQ